MDKPNSIATYTLLSIVMLMFMQDFANSDISYTTMYAYFEISMIVSLVLHI